MKKKYKFDCSQVYKVYKIIKEEKIDIVQTTLFYADIIGSLAARFANVRSVISWETVSHPPDSEEDQLRHKLAYGFCMKNVQKIIAVSDAVKTFVINDRNIQPHKVETIHYGIDLSLFEQRNGFLNKSKRTDLGFTNDNIVIGTVARLTIQKGHRYLIQAAPDIVKHFPNAHFVFSGDGPLREELEAQVSALGLEEHFHFLGFRKDVRDLLFTFDLFVLPSLFEGLPNVLLEAMASSRPVVATSVDGTPELVEQNKTGQLVPPKSPQPLGNAIIQILQQKDRGQKMGRQGRLRVEKHFSFEQQFEKFEKVYDSLLSAGKN